MGREQLDILTEEGVDLSRVIVGHSCGTADLRYHVDLLDRGAYLGFDRFGLELLQPDRLRLGALIGLLGIGFERQIVLSHDSVWCWRGRPLPIPAEQLAPKWDPRHIFSTSSLRCARPASRRARSTRCWSTTRGATSRHNRRATLRRRRGRWGAREPSNARLGRFHVIPAPARRSAAVQLYVRCRRAVSGRRNDGGAVRRRGRVGATKRARRRQRAAGYRERSLALHGWICAKCAREFDARTCTCSPSTTRTAITTTTRPTAATGRTSASTATTTSTAARSWPITCPGETSRND